LSWDIGSQVMMDKQVQVLNGVHREIHLPLWPQTSMYFLHVLRLMLFVPISCKISLVKLSSILPTRFVWVLQIDAFAEKLLERWAMCYMCATCNCFMINSGSMLYFFFHKLRFVISSIQCQDYMLKWVKYGEKDLDDGDFTNIDPADFNIASKSCKFCNVCVKSWAVL
jgi:hypothetical protein